MSLLLDRLFGPQFPGKFDFTLLFEHVMLSIVPGGVIVLAIPFYLNTAIRETRHVRSGLLLWLKLSVGIALLAIQTASLVMWHQASLFRSDAAVAAAAMSLAVSLCVVVILYVAHTYSLRPSGFLSVFLTITAFFDMTMARSYFQRSGMDIIASLQVSVVALKVLLIVCEEVPKRSLIQIEHLRSSVPSETVAGFWNRAVFGWLNSLMLFGYKNELTIDGLPNIDEIFNSVKLFDRFMPNWNRAKQASKFGLLKALFWTMPWDAFKVMPPRLIFVGLIFSQPFLLFDVVSAVQNGIESDYAYGLTGATGFIFTGITITRALYDHSSYRVLTAVRGILIVAIYDKIQQLPSEKLESLAAVTLITADITAVEQMLELFYEIWSSTILVGLGIWSLSLFVSRACFLMFIPSICSFIASHFLGKSMGAARKAWNEEIESRVAATSNVLAQLKGVKSMGLSQVMVEFLQAKRRKEIETSMMDRRARIWMFAISALSYVLSPVLVLAGALFWTRVSDPLDAAEMFTVLAIVNFTSSPFMTLLQSFMSWSGGFASLWRIQDFLRADVPRDMRITPYSTEDDEPSSSEKKTEEGHQLPQPAPFAIQFDLVAVTSTIMGPILKEVSLQIPWGALAMLWGPINCGKSTFLKCILGETHLDSGTVSVGTKSIAYCSQEPWLLNGTIRSNIIGALDLIQEWYDEVVIACGLNTDLSALINGDLFMTGTGGCNLSGGQKQRVSLARAVYAQMEIMVLDDVLSALDPDTAQFVFTNLFGATGLVRRWNCTVVMTTNQLQFLDDASMILRMHKGGRIEEQQPELSDGSNASGSVAGEPSGDGETGNSDESDDGSHAVEPANEQPPTVLPSVQPATKDLELRNAREQRKHGDWSLYSYFLASANVGVVCFWICFTAVAAVIQSMPRIFVRIWYTRHGSNRDYFIGYVVFSAATVIFNSLGGVSWFFFIIPKSSEELHYRIGQTTMFTTWQHLGQTDSGVLLNRFSQDMSLTSQFLPIAFMQFVYMSFSVLVRIGIIASGSAFVTPIILVIVAILVLIQHFYLRTSRQLRLLELESSAALISHLTETSAGIHHIRSFGWQEEFMARLHRALDRSQRPYYFLFCCQRWLSVVLDFTAAGASTILVYLSLTHRGTTSGSAVGLALLSLVDFSGVAGGLIRTWTNLETALGAISRIKRYCLETPQEKDTLDGPEIAQDWPNSGRLDFNCVSASYQGDGGTTQKVLDNVTFTIRPGDRVGISGRTGSGKSSIFMTLLRVVEFTGTVSIDGRNSKTVPREHLRSRITTLTQDGVELKGSFRFNIYPFAGSKPSDDVIISTLVSLGLWTHIYRHGGLDGDLALMRFSLSQKQLFFLARGILHHRHLGTRIVLMDEATSAMDRDASEELQALLDDTFAECTLLQIAHGENSFRAVNLHIKLDSGQVLSVERTRR